MTTIDLEEKLLRKEWSLDHLDPNKVTLAVGDVVVVKPGVVDPDFGGELGGWRGVIEEVDLEERLILIAWDQATLDQMTQSLWAQCDAEDLAQEKMYLDFDEVSLDEKQIDQSI